MQCKKRLENALVPIKTAVKTSDWSVEAFI